MHTYFIQGEPLTPIKIGKCENPAKRLAQLQTGSPHILRHLLILEGDNEREMHERFKNDRIRGEWFYPSKELLDFIKTKLEECGAVDSPNKFFVIAAIVNMYCSDRERELWNLWVASMHKITDAVLQTARHDSRSFDDLNEDLLLAAQTLRDRICEIPWLEK